MSDRCSVYSWSLEWQSQNRKIYQCHWYESCLVSPLHCVSRCYQAALPDSGHRPDFERNAQVPQYVWHNLPDGHWPLHSPRDKHKCRISVACNGNKAAACHSALCVWHMECNSQAACPKACRSIRLAFNLIDPGACVVNQKYQQIISSRYFGVDMVTSKK